MKKPQIEKVLRDMEDTLILGYVMLANKEADKLKPMKLSHRERMRRLKGISRALTKKIQELTAMRT